VSLLGIDYLVARPGRFRLTGAGPAPRSCCRSETWRPLTGSRIARLGRGSDVSGSSLDAEARAARSRLRLDRTPRPDILDRRGRVGTTWPRSISSRAGSVEIKGGFAQARRDFGDVLLADVTVGSLTGMGASGRLECDTGRAAERLGRDMSGGSVSGLVFVSPAAAGAESGRLTEFDFFLAGVGRLNYQPTSRVDGPSRSTASSISSPFPIPKFRASTTSAGSFFQNAPGDDRHSGRSWAEETLRDGGDPVQIGQDHFTRRAGRGLEHGRPSRADAGEGRQLTPAGQNDAFLARRCPATSCGAEVTENSRSPPGQHRDPSDAGDLR
jgi:hypothetical protein